MARQRKYHSEAEQLLARRERQLRYYQRNKEEKKQKMKEYYQKSTQAPPLPVPEPLLKAIEDAEAARKVNEQCRLAQTLAVNGNTSEFLEEFDQLFKQ
jgi:hypothetical protein